MLSNISQTEIFIFVDEYDKKYNLFIFFNEQNIK